MLKPLADLAKSTADPDLAVMVAVIGETLAVAELA